MNLKCPDGCTSICVGGQEYLARGGVIRGVPDEFEAAALAAGYEVVAAPAPTVNQTASKIE